MRNVRTHHALEMGLVSATPHWEVKHQRPTVLFVLHLTENLLQTEITPFPHGRWRKLSGAGHLGSLANSVVHITEKVGRCVFDFSDAVRMNSRLHLGVPFKA